MIHFCENVAFSHRNKREENQDTCGYMLCQSAPNQLGASVLFVADGVSNSHGLLAAETISQKIRRPMARLLSDCLELSQLPQLQQAQEVFAELRALILEMDRQLRPLGDCSATFSLALVLGSYVYTANIGDSPILLVQLDDDDLPVQLQELYESHNKAGLAVRMGQMTKEEALANPDRNYLTRQVVGGGVTEDSIYTAKAGLYQNNLLLLGSDGALSVLTDEELLALIGNYMEMGLQEVNDQLFDTVQKHPRGDDNYTLLGQWIRTS